MESATTTPTQPDASQEAPPEERRDAPGEGNGPESIPAETADPVRLLRFSDEVHVGVGAEECEHSRDGSCENPDHFHAFIRLPNELQRKSLIEKAEAAKARRMRQLRDPESDIATILDSEMEELARNSDHEALVDEVVGFDFVKDHISAMREVMEDEEYQHIEDDRERLRALSAMPDDERPEDEFRELEKHVLAYTEAVGEARERIQKPLRDAMLDKGVEELLELVRAERERSIAREAGEDAYSEWEWFIGTLKTRVPTKVTAPQQRVWATVDDMRAAPDEVIAALQAAYRDIEAAAGRSLQKAAAG